MRACRNPTGRCPTTAAPERLSCRRLSAPVPRWAGTRRGAAHGPAAARPARCLRQSAPVMDDPEGLRRSWGRRLFLEREVKTRPATGLALRPDAACVAPHDPLYGRQPDSGSFELVG